VNKLITQHNQFNTPLYAPMKAVVGGREFAAIIERGLMIAVVPGGKQWRPRFFIADRVHLRYTDTFLTTQVLHNKLDEWFRDQHIRAPHSETLSPLLDWARAHITRQPARWSIHAAVEAVAV